MKNLQRLVLHTSFPITLDADTIRAFQPALRENRYLQELRLSQCRMYDEGLHLIADALVGNTTLEILNIRQNEITSNGIADITRLVEDSRLKELNLSRNPVFSILPMFSILADTLQVDHDTCNAIHQFGHALSRNKYLKTLKITMPWPTSEVSLIFPYLETNTTLEHLSFGPLNLSGGTVGFFRINDNPIGADMEPLIRSLRVFRR
jgi:Leucine Rich repeat/Leucine Rich Repeat